jgi:hypothetical protein
MKTDQLKSCIEALKALRQETHKELGTGVDEELKAVIEQLEDCMRDNKDDAKVPHHLSQRALSMLASVLSIATNMTRLIQLFFDSE